MASLHHVKKSNAGKPIKCGECEKEIAPGTMYYWWAFFRGPRFVRCEEHKPRPSQLINSKMAPAYGAIETAEAAINKAGATIEDIAAALEECAGEIEAVRDDYQEGYDNMPDFAQNGATGEDSQNKIDELENFASNLNSVAEEIRAMENDDGEAGGGDNPESDSVKQAIETATQALDEFSL